jgi:hypothetical protein
MSQVVGSSPKYGKRTKINPGKGLESGTFWRGGGGVGI